MQPDLFASTGRTDDAQTLADLEVDYTPVAVALPAALRRWSPTAVPGTFEIDPALVAEVARYLP